MIAIKVECMYADVVCDGESGRSVDDFCNGEVWDPSAEGASYFWEGKSHSAM